MFVPLYCPRRPRHEFVNTNNDIDEQELKNVNDKYVYPKAFIS